jgi:hypothetical protein
MADNVTLGSATYATDDIGGVQYPREKMVWGADGVANDVSATNPVPITIIDPSTTTAFSTITAANTALSAAIDTANDSSILLQTTGAWTGSVRFQASNDGTNWWDTPGQSWTHEAAGPTDTIYANDLVSVPVIGRFFRVITGTDFAGSVGGTYALRQAPVVPSLHRTVLVDVDPQVTLPVAGLDPNGYKRTIAVTETGQVQPPDGRFLSAFRTSVGTIQQLDTTGFNSVSLQVFGTFVGTVTFQVSNDATTWTAVIGWAVSGAATPVSTATAAGHFLIPAIGRFFRAQVTAYTSGSIGVAITLKNQNAFFPTSTPAVNAAQIAGTATVTSGVAGIQAIGGNIAVAAAPTANPIPLAWDGTNTRRILTDASNGGIVLGSNAITNGQSLARVTQTATTPAATAIKGSAGRLTMLNISNGGTVAGFLHLYNSTAVSLGSTSDSHVYAVPASVSAFAIPMPDGGLFFSTGISAAFTAGVAATDNTVFGSAPTLVANYAFI